MVELSLWPECRTPHLWIHTSNWNAATLKRIMERMELRYIILLTHFCNVNPWKWITCSIGVPSVSPFSRFQRTWFYDYRCAWCFVIVYDRRWMVPASSHTSPEPVHRPSNKTQRWLWGHTFVWPKISRTFFQNSIVVMDTATYEETHFVWFNDTWIEALLCHCRENGRCWEFKLQDICLTTRFRMLITCVLT